MEGEASQGLSSKTHRRTGPWPCLALGRVLDPALLEKLGLTSQQRGVSH